MDPLVSTGWLADALGADDLVVLDASYTSSLPGAPVRDALAGYRAGHVPGARFLDLDTLVDAAADLPSTLPPAALVAERLAALGVSQGSRIVLYDDVPHRTAARAWWLLKAHGLERVALLDGGLARWRDEGRALAQGDEPATAAAPMALTLDAGRLRTLDQMRRAVAAGEPIADARSDSRFTGDEPDPRAGVAPGHMPGAASLPYTRLFDADGRWKRGDALAAAFRDAGIDPGRPFVATCGSGITACVLAFGAHLLGGEAAVYDGSWSEWGAEPSTAKAIGPA